MERLSPLDLDQMARAIADAVHGVGEEGAWEGPGRGAGGNTGEPAGSSEEPLSEGSERGRDGPRGETPYALWAGGPTMDAATEPWGPRLAKLGCVLSARRWDSCEGFVAV